MANKKKPASRSISSAANKTSRFVVLVIAIIAVLVLVLIFLNNNSGSSDASSEIDYENQPYLGQEDAAVKIVEFGDYKCSHCHEFHENVFPAIDQEFVQTGEAQFYYMNFPIINQDSETGAQFAEAVYQVLGNDQFWEFHDALFEENLDTEFTEEYLTNTLKDFVSDEESEEILRVFQDNQTEDAVAEDKNQGEDLGVSGTPTIFVNGERWESGEWSDLEDMVEEAAQETE